ncbi:hypothetical protein EVAR_91041_1 [Eumeta japonica]|uniref:Transposable element P transposase-like GTP-binding insertion domain-containing protein n=1 Tax=Eumeta variegata TaxID=151549 RepID=A0A4C1TH31_EUMVA|nr:hypothetical protein EVAR_91041_1 [Eumeta japonica]
MLLEVDVGEHEIRLVNKLTEQHVNKDKIPKMKVSVAAQVFSQRVSANEVLAIQRTKLCHREVITKGRNGVNCDAGGKKDGVGGADSPQAADLRGGKMSRVKWVEI